MEEKTGTRGSGPLRIRDIRVVVTAPEGHNLIVVIVETEEPGLRGLGCATYAYRPHAVTACIERHLRPLLIGRDARNIADLYQLVHYNAYWRNGPVVNNALSGIDMALWDLKGREAGMPLYQLFGGACRDGATVYWHANGDTLEEVEASVQAHLEAGVSHVRVQFSGYGGAKEADWAGSRPPGIYYDPAAYRRSALKALGHIRDRFGEAVELLHDVHERLHPAEAVAFAREVEPLKLFFLEDPLPPEQLDWMGRLRQASATPIAIGELFTHPAEWTTLVARREVDFLRMHLSAMGGLTPARKAAILAEAFGVRTAWHGPPDQSPVGHAACLHLDLASPNFGIREGGRFSEALREVFPGCPETRHGRMYASGLPGLGVDFNEAAAAAFPPNEAVTEWTQARRPDGSLNPP